MLAGTMITITIMTTAMFTNIITSMAITNGQDTSVS